MTGTVLGADSQISAFERFVVKKRVALSFIIFTTILTSCACMGMVPREFISGHDLVSGIGIGMVICGLALRSWAAGTLVKYYELTTTGIYSIMRNPLYLGSFLMISGFCVQLDRPTLPLAAAFVLIPIYIVTVRKEERHLESTFGDAWRNYASRTKRFLPSTWSPNFKGWSFAQWLKNHEYRAVLTTGLIYIALEIWETISFPD
ncbi:MAG: isoprenylcysteine carboxylmethyltransferase family protein [Pirellulales bacterium]